MSATPRATDEYSTGGGGSRGPSEGRSGPEWRAARRRSAPVNRGVGKVIFAVVIVGSVLLVAAEFSTLYHVHVSTKLNPIKSVTAGSHNSLAMLPIAALAAAFGYGVWRTGNRTALLAVGVLGVTALLLALLHDLPDAHAVGLADNNSVNATTTPGIGLYLETAGAILLIASSGLGFIVVRAPRLRAATRGSTRREA
jgi:di/tricarboxylate transporter